MTNTPENTDRSPARRQAYIIECDNLGPGEQIWFSSRFEAEQGFLDECCKLIPVPANYDGPKWIAEDWESAK